MPQQFAPCCFHKAGDNSFVITVALQFWGGFAKYRFVHSFVTPIMYEIVENENETEKRKRLRRIFMVTFSKSLLGSKISLLIFELQRAL